MRALAAEVAASIRKELPVFFLQVQRDLEAGQVGNEGSSSHYNTKLRCHRSCSSSRLGLLNTDGLKHFPYSQYLVQW